MPSYSFTVFKWTGTGYNAQYDTSHTAVIQDDDATYEGRHDSDEQISIDGGDFAATASTPYAIDVSFTDTDGVDHVETFQFMYADGAWFFAPGADSAFTEGATLGSYQSHTSGWDYDDVTCFAAGTLIATPGGKVPVETLQAGDVVLDRQGARLPIVQILKRRFGPLDLARQPKLRPIRISEDALGKGLPATDLLVSRQHRILLKTRAAKTIVGADECLVAACRLLALPGVRVDPAPLGVEYYHIAVRQHAVLAANGIGAESFYPGPQAMRGLPETVVAELYSIFGKDDVQSAQVPFARPCPKGRDQKRIVSAMLNP